VVRDVDCGRDPTGKELMVPRSEVGKIVAAVKDDLANAQKREEVVHIAP
jgi:hypothetical protein